MQKDYDAVPARWAGRALHRHRYVWAGALKCSVVSVCPAVPRGSRKWVGSYASTADCTQLVALCSISIPRPRWAHCSHGLTGCSLGSFRKGREERSARDGHRLRALRHRVHPAERRPGAQHHAAALQWVPIPWGVAGLGPPLPPRATASAPSTPASSCAQRVLFGVNKT